MSLAGALVEGQEEELKLGGREEISAFAERVLFSDRLADKLRAPAELTDHHPTQSSLAHIVDVSRVTPSRPDTLRLAARGETRRAQRDLRPKLKQLADPMTRARLLHTFAHHELISLELMALALLRFPDAPRAFRRGLAQVIIDEQRHFSLYHDRVSALGLELGAEPVSDYFWRCVADAATPSEFNARLALVFEQANIDFTRYYGPLLRELGDVESADALEVIYHDEISHVGFGLHWFRRWRPANEPEWDSFCALLRPPLSPGRARGATFSVEGRRAAGFSESFIEQLKLWGGSTGRPPRVWHGNVDVEEEWRAWQIAQLRADQARDARQQRPDQRRNQRLYVEQSARGRSKNIKMRTATRRALTPLLGWMCTRGDVVLCPHGEPSRQWRQLLQSMIGFNPEWAPSVETLNDRTLGALSPWGWSPESASLLAPLHARLISSAPPTPLEALSQTSALGQTPSEQVSYEQASELSSIFGKRWDLELKRSSHTLICASVDGDLSDPSLYMPPRQLTALLSSEGDLDEFLTSIERDPERRAVTRWVFKSDLSNAGRGLLTLDRDRPLSEPERGWLKRQLSWGVIVEPWLERVADLSFHGRVEREQTQYDGVVVGLVNDRGRFYGAELAPPSRVLSQPLKRFLNREGRERHWLRQIGRRVIELTGEALRASGYTGVFGVDALLARAPHLFTDPPAGSSASVSTQLCLYPLVEVNPRHTMGRLALHLRNTLDPQSKLEARLTVYPPRRLTGGVVARLRAQLEVSPPRRDEGGRWSGGVIPLTDLWSATSERDPLVLLEPLAERILAEVD